MGPLTMASGSDWSFEAAEQYKGERCWVTNRFREFAKTLLPFLPPNKA